MRTFPRSILAVLVTGCLAWLSCREADAAPIIGDIDFGGVVTFDTISLATATKVMSWNTAVVLKDSGDFATFVPVPPGGPYPAAIMGTPWVFNPSTACPALWQVGGFKFDLTTSAVITQSATFLNITGVGTVTGNGFDPTPGLWSFTSSNHGGSDRNTFSFQANAEAVPESSTVALFATGALGLAGMQSLRKKGKAVKKVTSFLS